MHTICSVTLENTDVSGTVIGYLYTQERNSKQVSLLCHPLSSFFCCRVPRFPPALVVVRPASLDDDALDVLL